MGKCGTYSKPVTLAQLQDVALNEKYESPYGCGSNLTAGNLGSKGFSWPANYEFEWGGQGNPCGVCSADYGCECHGEDAVVGSRGTVKRVAYLGNPTDCCEANIQGLNTAKTLGGKTCNPIYRNPQSTSCEIAYRNKCVGANILNAECSKLADSNNALHTSLMRDYCASDTQSEVCRNWCRTRADCTKLDNITDCGLFGLQSDCSAADIASFELECQKRGFINNYGHNSGTYTCSKDGIEQIKVDCDSYGLTEGNCTSNGVNNAKLIQMDESVIEESERLAESSISETKNLLAEILGGGGNFVTNNLMWIVLIIMFLIFSSVIVVMII